jgi:sugar phosphate isomerase/epimerase
MTRRDLLAAAMAATALRGARPLSAAARRQHRAAVLARIGMMTLNFTTLLKTPHQPPSPERTLDLFDLPEMYADTYGVHNIELQHYHMASTDPSYFRALRERIDRAKSKAIQLVVEFGGLNISAPDHNFLPRLQAVDLTSVWIDRAAVLGCPRIMVNQGQPTRENRQYAIDTLKLMVDYGKAHGVKVTLETRGGGGGARGAAPAGGPPAPAPEPPAEPAWVLLNDIARSAGAFINIDFGGVRAGSQAELHAAFDGLFPAHSGSMHTRLGTSWDLPTALRYLESKGYDGYYSIEARGHEGTRPVYDAILATL